MEFIVMMEMMEQLMAKVEGLRQENVRGIGNGAGGWSPFGRVTKADEKVFYEAVEGLCGGIYIPLLVSTQLVAGTNYAFIAQKINYCTCRVIGYDLIIVSQDLQGNVTLVEVIKLI